MTQLVSDFRRGRVSPVQDDRLRLQVFELSGRVRSVNNRRLWVLKKYQELLRLNTSDIIQVAVNLHSICKGTAKFIDGLCECETVAWLLKNFGQYLQFICLHVSTMSAPHLGHPRPKVSEEVRAHPDTKAAQRTLRQILAAKKGCRSWVFEDKAMQRSVLEEG